MSDLVWTPIKIKLGQIIPWSDNPRMSTKAQAQRLIKSERELGQIQTLAVSPFEDGKVYLYDGHQRCAAWMTVKDPSYEVTALQSNRMLTDDERKKVSVLLHTATGSWSWEALSSWSAADLREWGMDEDTLKGWNNDASNLKELLNSEKPEPVDAEPQIDRAAELAEKWQTKSGQLWKLGEHRLLIGDCTVRENVERLMGGERAQMCFTSPPYNAGKTATEKDTDKASKYNGDLDNKDGFDYLGLLRDFTNNALLFCEYAFVNIQVIAGNKAAFIQYWYENADKFADVAIWDKKTAQPAAAHKVMDSRFEFVLIFGGNGSRAIGTRDFRGMVHNVYEGSPQRHNENADIHAATMPIDLPEHFIKTFTNDSELIYEPFCGTGTTIIAAHNLNRRCFAMELSEKYGAVILERFYTATGITPELVENG